MIALAILFLIIISLLVVVFRLLQKFFAAYVNMYTAKCLPDEVLETNNRTSQFNQELNSLTVSRDEALEQYFITLESGKTESPQKTDMLIESLKIYLQSILKLLKTE